MSSSLYSSNMHFPFDISEDVSFFRPEIPGIGLKGKRSLKINSSNVVRKDSTKVIRTSLRITDFSMIRELQDTLPSPNQDALVPQLEELPVSLVDLKGSITATIEDLERMQKSGPDGPLSLLGSVPSIHMVENVKDFEQSSELHLLDETEPSVNIEEILRRNSALSSVSSMDQTISPSSVYSGASSPAHFFEPSESLPTTLEFVNPSSYGFADLTPKKEEVFLFGLPSTCSTSSMSGMFSNGDSSNPTEVRYTEMRRKNNLASKRSRQTRREKEIEMEMKAKKYEDENAQLRKKMKQLEEATEKLKKHIIYNVMQKK